MKNKLMLWDLGHDNNPHVITPPQVGYLSRTHNAGKTALYAPVATRIKWTCQIASGLHHLHHAAHTYHGDVKLDNVVLDETGDVVLVDLNQGRANEVNTALELRAASLVSVEDHDRTSCIGPPP